MDTQLTIPAMDPMPLPAPLWLFQLLLVLTFVLHLVAMNLMFGGAVLATVSKLRAKNSEFHGRLAQDLARKIPSFLAASVTLGIAPLLFLQVLYGQFFYSSSIVMAWPWFFVVVLLVIAYYGFYLVAMKGDRAGNTAFGWALLLSVFLIFVIGFFYTNNITLMSTPQTWAAKHLADTGGTSLNWSEGSLVPRYLHFVTAAIALGGLLVAALGIFRWTREPDYARFLVGVGGRWFLFATMVQVVIGLWWLISLPREMMMIFMGGNPVATAGLLIGFLLALGVIFLMSGALRQEDPRRGVVLSMVLTGVLVAIMAIMRHLLRDAYLAGIFQPGSFAVQTQWDVLILFLVLFLAGVGLWFVMIKKFFFSPELHAGGK
jgi:hypothetical protein